MRVGFNSWQNYVASVFKWDIDNLTSYYSTVASVFEWKWECIDNFTI